MADHLHGSRTAEGCPRYQEWARVQKDDEKTVKKQRLLDESLVIRISEERKKKINKELAQCLFETGKTLSMFDSPCWKEFFKQNFGYTILSRRMISESLLDSCYVSSKDDVSS
jgi:hypothetical protein